MIGGLTGAIEPDVDSFESCMLDDADPHHADGWSVSTTPGTGPSHLPQQADITEYRPVLFVDGVRQEQFYRNCLEASGIPTMVETATAEEASCSTPPGRVALLVPAEMSQQAAEVLATADAEFLAGFDDDDSDDDDDFSDDDYDDDLDDAEDDDDVFGEDDDDDF